MGMSFNMYLCDKTSFENIKEKTLKNIDIDLGKYSIKSFYLEKMYCGLEFIFKKIFPENIVKIIFYGSDIISSIDLKSQQFKNLPQERLIDLYINTLQLSYINYEFIKEIYKYFLSEDGDGIYNGFNENELNENKIYPENWEKTFILWKDKEEKILFAKYFKDEYLKIKILYKEAIENGYLIFVEIK